MHVAISEFIDPIRRRRIDSRCSLSRFVVARFVRRLVSSDRALSHNTLVLLPLQHTYEFTHAALDYVQATRLSSTKNRGVARAQRLMRARKPHQRRRTARVSAAETRSHAELIAREPISFCKFIHQWQSNGLRARGCILILLLDGLYTLRSRSSCGLAQAYIAYCEQRICVR